MISIKGVKVKAVNIKCTDDNRNVTGDYVILSSTDKVIAKQGFNGYNEIAVALSPDTEVLLDNFLSAMEKDVEKTTGLCSDEGK